MATTSIIVKNGNVKTKRVWCVDIELAPTADGGLHPPGRHYPSVVFYRSNHTKPAEATAVRHAASTSRLRRLTSILSRHAGQAERNTLLYPWGVRAIEDT